MTMTTRQRFNAVLNFQPFDRLPMIEWAIWWDQTLARWRTEGLPDLPDSPALQRYFGLDVHLQDWISSRAPSCPQAPSHGAPIIATEADYERLRPHLFPDTFDAARWEKWAAQQAAGDVIVWFTIDGFFWFPRKYLGIEPHLLAFYDQPKLMHRINSDLADWMLRCIEKITRICTPDFMTFAEDMSYNHGPMLSQDLFNEFMKPYYDRVVPALKRHNIRTIVDSDGDITRAWPWFESAGLDGILPLERQAGVDVAALRKSHPKARFIGCFDKLVMHKGEAAIRAEFERLLPTAKTGGLIISVDHQTPPGVSLQNYQLYLRLYREYAARAAQPT